MCSCTPQTLRQAQQVVVAADSLWTNGQMFRDSAQLAQAYESLGKWQILYADEYAHACYHYGRLLRELNDPVSAMQAFIDVTHSHTRDYHILGRVYSNMGSICHLASEFPLSYDMYEKSADCFLRNGDSLNYYYALNDMAYELAEQGKKDSCSSTIDNIASLFINDTLTAYCYITKARACYKCELFDSVVYYAMLSKRYVPLLSASALQLAQAYSCLGIKDSATYYANMLLCSTQSLFEKNNALYILTNDDDGGNIAIIRQTAAERADIQKLLEIRQGKMSQAVQLLEQDLHRKMDLKWLYAVCVTLCIIGLCVLIVIRIKRRKHTLLSQQLNDVKEEHTRLTEQYEATHRQIREDIERNCELLRNDENLGTNMAWGDFETMCCLIDQQFYMFTTKLRRKNILNETEIRLCFLVLLNMSRAEISRTLPYALSSVGKLKDHTAKLLGTTGKNLHNFLLKVAIEG